MQHVGGGDAAGEIAINVDVIGIEDIRDIDDGGDGDAAFVDAAIHGDVGVAVDDAGDHELAGGIDHLRVFRSLDRRPTSAIFPSLIKIDPCSMVPWVTVRMVAF